jgi:hypothetical protein
MSMTFDEAEARFRELQARIQRGESISRVEYEEQVSQLAVQDKSGVLWEINPRTSKWMYFDGATWVSGTPPGHDTSAVIPLRKDVPPPPPITPAPGASKSTSAPQPTRPSTPSPSRTVTPSRPVSPPSAPTAPMSGGPEAIPSTARPKPGRQPLARPSGDADSSGRGASFLGRNREWIPLAIIAAVLFACAIILLVASTVLSGGGLAFLPGGAKPTSTKVSAPTLPATQIPTPVRLPTQPPPSPTSVPVIAKPSGDYANIRATPSITAAQLGRLNKDSQVTLLEQTKIGTFIWYKINVPNKTDPGWVRNDTVTIISGDPNTLPGGGGTGPVTPTTIRPVVSPTATVIGVFPSPTPTTKAP